MKTSACFMTIGLALAWAIPAPVWASGDENVFQKESEGEWLVYDGANDNTPVIIEAPGLKKSSETRWLIDMVPLSTDTEPLALLLPGGLAELENLLPLEQLKVFFPESGIPQVVQNAGDTTVMPSSVMPEGTMALAGGWTVLVRITQETESETLENHRARGRGAHNPGNSKNSEARPNSNAKDALDATATTDAEGIATQGNEQESILKNKHAQIPPRMPEILSGSTQSRLNRARDEHRQLKAFSVN